MAFQDSLEQLKTIDINNIDFEKIGVWPLPAKIFVGALVVGLVFLVTYFVEVSSLNDQFSSLESKEKTLRQSFESKSFEAANLDAYRSQMEEMDKTFNSLLTRLPKETEVAGLLEDVGARGTESGLNMGGIGMEAEKTAEFYVEVPFKVTVDGSYHDMGGFVSGIAGMPRIVTLHDFAITKKKDSSGLTMAMSAKTYRYKSQEQSK